MQAQKEGTAAPGQAADGDNGERDRVLRRQLNFIADALVGDDPRRGAGLAHLRAAPAVGRQLAGRLVARLLKGDDGTALRAGEALAAAGWGAVPALHEALMKARRPADQLLLVGALASVGVGLDVRGRGAAAAVLGGMLAEGVDMGVRMAAIAALAALRPDRQTA